MPLSSSNKWALNILTLLLPNIEIRATELPPHPSAHIFLDDTFIICRIYSRQRVRKKNQNALSTNRPGKKQNNYHTLSYVSRKTTSTWPPFRLIKVSLLKPRVFLFLGCFSTPARSLNQSIHWKLQSEALYNEVSKFSAVSYPSPHTPRTSQISVKGGDCWASWLLNMVL